MPHSDVGLARPDDAFLYRQALRRIRQQAGVPFAFGGQLSDDALVLSEFVGAQTDKLRGLHVESGKGVGGRVLARRRPYGVNNYEAAHTITHDYDDPVLSEGIYATVAVPVAVRGAVRGVLYAAVRSVFPLGDRATSAMLDVSRRIAGELVIRDEVDRRLQLLETAMNTAEPAPPDRAELQHLHAELRSIAGELGDDALRERLQQACDRFAVLGARGQREPQSMLSPRELDVLTQVALGCSNAEAAERLCLQPETVKAYLRSATRKLGVHGRYQAVLTARREGLLP